MNTEKLSTEERLRLDRDEALKHACSSPDSWTSGICHQAATLASDHLEEIMKLKTEYNQQLETMRAEIAYAVVLCEPYTDTKPGDLQHFFPLIVKNAINALVARAKSPNREIDYDSVKNLEKEIAHLHSECDQRDQDYIRELKKTRAQRDEAHSRISKALEMANFRWSEWGTRAVAVADILEGNIDE